MFPFLFVLALFVALFIRRPEKISPRSSNPGLVAQKPAEQLVFRGETMGTTYLVKLVVENEQDKTEWSGLQTQFDQKLEAINDLMSTYRPKSAISRFNESGDTKSFPVEAEFFHVVSSALDIGKKTQGAFDITLGPLIDAWGFDKTGRHINKPSAESIASLKPYVGLDKVTAENGGIQKADPRVRINLSGIAKGYAVDSIAALVEEAGAERFMVEIGGEIAVKGMNAKGRPWKLGINRPTPEATRLELIGTAELEKGAMATSGSYRNFFSREGRRYHHIIDPRTGAPVLHTLVSVTVIAPNCMQADALATAAMVLGQEAFEKSLVHFPKVSALFVHQKGDQFDVTRTSNFPGSSDRIK
ncbi:MAG: FAD:protein FMN transferase [Myxococcota bacterium]|nr:FAD:protein FMN transferase [Myxococcota bacterium]